MSGKQPKIIMLFGRSGCGKGTQAELLQKEFGFESLSSGNLLRQRAKISDFSGKKIKEVVEKGKLIPSFLMFQILIDEIKKIRDKKDLEGLVIDGSPRVLVEAKLMDEAFKWYGWKDIYPVLLDISKQEAFNRLTKRRICKECGQLIPWVGEFKNLKRCDLCSGELMVRSDDQPEAINARLDYYEKEVKQVVDYYKKQDRLIKVDGEKTIEDVYHGLKQAIS